MGQVYSGRKVDAKIKRTLISETIFMYSNVFFSWAES